MDFRDCKIGIEVHVCGPNDGPDVIARGPVGYTLVWTFQPRGEDTITYSPPSTYSLGQLLSIAEQIQKGVDDPLPALTGPQLHRSR